MSVLATDIFTDVASRILASEIIRSRKPMTDDEKDAYWWRFAEKTLAQERRFKPMLRELFSYQQDEVMRRLSEHEAWIEAQNRSCVSGIQKVNDDDVDILLFNSNVWDAKLQAAEEPHIRKALLAAGQEFMDDALVGISFDVTNPRVVKYIEEKTFKFSFDVNDSTLSALRKQFVAGLNEGEGIYGLQRRVKDVFGIAKTSRSNLIARTEIIGANNFGTFESYRQSQIVKEKAWIWTRDENTRDTHRDIEPVPLNEKFSNGLMYPGDYHAPASEICNCFVNHNTPIFTNKGWIPISKIKKGHKVLTHYNRFRKVTRVLDAKAYQGAVVKIALRKDKTITATPEHLIIMADGTWRPIGDVAKGEKVRVLASYCRRCGVAIPWWNVYCSVSCSSLDTTDRQRGDLVHRMNMSRKASRQMKREYENGTRDPKKITRKARAVCKEKYGPGLYLGVVRDNPKFQEKIHNAIVDKYGSRSEHLKQGAFKALGVASWKGSSIERSMRGYLDSQNKTYVPQYIVGRRRVDFYLPDEQLFIECDSSAYHNDESAERKRDLEILMEYPDHQIAHVFYQGNENPNWEFFDLSKLNHTETFTYTDCKVTNVIRWNLRKARRLYNFAVEEDESYVVRGIYAHNCRCALAAESFRD